MFGFVSLSGKSPYVNIGSTFLSSWYVLSPIYSNTDFVSRTISLSVWCFMVSNSLWMLWRHLPVGHNILFNGFSKPNWAFQLKSSYFLFIHNWRIFRNIFKGWFIRVMCVCVCVWSSEFYTSFFFWVKR